MEKTIIRFITILRRGGLTVSLSEGEDAARGLAAFGVEDPETVRAVLRATLLKNEDQKDVFDLAWRVCFRREEAFPAETEITPGECGGHDGEPGTAGMSPMARRFYGLLRDRRGGEAAELIDAALREEPGRELTAAEMAEQLKISLGWFMADYALKQNGDEEGKALLSDIERYLKLRCERVRIEAKGEEGVAELIAAANSADKDFSALSESQVRLMEKQIARLGKKLAGRYSYRLKPAKHGVPDTREIMAETARRGHLPAEMRRLSKRRDRPDLVILCDISGSMGIYSAFCLQLVCAMERYFRSVRSFLFIDSVVETTLSFRSGTVAEGVAAAMEKAYPKRTGRSKEQCTTTGVSDYGRAMETFHRVYGEVLTKTATVLIVGDAKTNWFPPKPEEIRTIREKTKKLIWLNPEPAETWGKEDSAADQYAPFCDAMLECRNLKQLEKAMMRV